jgi:hypothetical protein
VELVLALVDGVFAPIEGEFVFDKSGFAPDSLVVVVLLVSAGATDVGDCE